MVKSKVFFFLFFCKFEKYLLVSSNKTNVPITFEFKNSTGLSIDLSTCVSAAKCRIISGLNFFKIALILRAFETSIFFE